MAVVRVEIVKPFLELTDGKNEVDACGETVADVIRDLFRQYPALKSRYCRGEALREGTGVYLNDEEVRYYDNLQTVVSEGQHLILIPFFGCG